MKSQITYTLLIYKRKSYINLETRIRESDFIPSADHPINEDFIKEQELIAKQNQILKHALEKGKHISTETKKYYHITQDLLEKTYELLESLYKNPSYKIKTDLSKVTQEDLKHQLLLFICLFESAENYFLDNPYQGFSYALH